MTAGKVTIYDYVQSDLNNCHTPDLPALRYMGLSHVFLWDDLQKDDVLQDELFGCSKGKDYSTVFSRAITKGSYIPFYSLVDRANQPFAAFCLEDFEDLSYIGDMPDYCLADPKPLIGKIIKASVSTIEDLDYYYENEKSFSRVLIDVKPNAESQTKMKVWCYMNSLDDIAEYDSKNKDYKLRDNVDLTPFVERDNMYKMGGYDA